jgi:hypothetical protein
MDFGIKNIKRIIATLVVGWQNAKNTYANVHNEYRFEKPDNFVPPLYRIHAFNPALPWVCGIQYDPEVYQDDAVLYNYTICMREKALASQDLCRFSYWLQAIIKIQRDFPLVGGDLFKNQDFIFCEEFGKVSFYQLLCDLGLAEMFNGDHIQQWNTIRGLVRAIAEAPPINWADFNLNEGEMLDELNQLAN